MRLTGKRLLLILLYAPTKGEEVNIPIVGRTRLMKMFFLFDRELLARFKSGGTVEAVDLPEYFAWKYGPFSVDLLRHLEFLINREFVEASLTADRPLPEETAEYQFWIEDPEELADSQYDQESFSLTSTKGVPKGVELWGELSNSQRQLLVDFKSSMVGAPLARILEYVYRNYEEEGMTRKSVIKGRFEH